MRTALTFGRRSTTIMSLNLGGKDRRPFALHQASQEFRSDVDKLGTFLSGALTLGQHLTVGLGVALGETANCAIEQ